MTAVWVGGSNLRSPSPSAIKTIAYCNPPFESTTTSRVRTGRECCLAQLGSADILMGSGAGTIPANLTTPFITVAPALVVSEGRSPAFTTRWLEMQIINVKTVARTKSFAFILHLGEGLSLTIFLRERNRSAYLVCRTRLSSAARL